MAMTDMEMLEMIVATLKAFRIRIEKLEEEIAALKANDTTGGR